MNTNNSEPLKKAYKTAGFIGFAFIASVFIYAGIVEFLYRGNIINSKFNPQAVLYLRVGFLFLAVLDIFIANFFREGIKSGKILIKPKKEAKPLFPENVSRLFYSTIIPFAFYEFIAVLGLILFLLTGLYKDFYVFFIGSMVMFFIHFPRFQQWEEVIRSQSSQ